MLDVDMNVKGESQEPVENIRWISQAPWGRYTVLVNLFRLHPDGTRRPKRETAYELLAQLGEETSVRDGIVSPGLQVDVMRFVYFPQQLPPLERQQGLNQIQVLQEGEESAAKPLLEDAKQSAGTVRQRKLQNIVRRYPHTDAAIEAMQLMVGEIVKR
jgi:hypothetical protein